MYRKTIEYEINVCCGIGKKYAVDVDSRPLVKCVRIIEASMMDVTRTVEPEGERSHWVCRIRNCSTMKCTYDGKMCVSSLNGDIDTVI